MKNKFNTNATFTSKNGNIILLSDLFSSIYWSVVKAEGKEFGSYDAEDVFQDAALKALRSLGNYDESRAGIKTFGSIIAKTTGIDAGNKRRKFGDTFADHEYSDKDDEMRMPMTFGCYRGDEFEADADLRTNEAMARIEAAISKLGEEDRKILFDIIDGDKPAKIAARMGLTANAVSVRLNRTRKTLKRELRTLLDEYGMAA